MLQLDDLLTNYPKSDVPDIQAVIASKKEFADVGSYPNEPIPQPGEYFNNQKFVQRYLTINDRLLLMWETGTGKTCGVVAAAEYYHDLYIDNPNTATIKHAIFLTRGDTLIADLRQQIACNCTDRRYLTSNVVEAKKDKSQRAALKREMDKWYTIDTYQKFFLKLAEYSDEAIRKMYSNVLFFVDEAHNLNVEVKGDRVKRGTKEQIYLQAHRLFHLIEGSKVILATATPMINESREVAPLMNLILPLDQQLPLDWNYDRVTLEELEPYFRGRISFVRAVDTGINVNLVGEEINIPYDTPEGPNQSDIVVDVTSMGEIQTEGYIRAREKHGGNIYEEDEDLISSRDVSELDEDEDDDLIPSSRDEASSRDEKVQTEQRRRQGVFDDERQASNFVFPDGSWGGNFSKTDSGLGKYVTSPSPDRYIPREDFLPYITGLDNLRELSSKYARVIEEIQNGPPGTAFVYNDFVVGSGVILHGVCFEANGFERYTGDQRPFEEFERDNVPICGRSSGGNRRVLLPKTGEILPSGKRQKPRYALITRETKRSNVERIKELFNSPENIHGEYLKVILTSQIAREGISLSHATQVFLVTTWWNKEANYQAISRAIRATSHVFLLEEEMERLAEAGEDPNQARVDVNIYKQAAIVDDDYDTSIDLYMYSVAERKSYGVRRVLRFMKITAADCLINYQRNIRPNHPYTNEGEMAQTYECYQKASGKEDRSTYNVYYIDYDILPVIDQVLDLFNQEFSYSREEIYRLLEGNDPLVIDHAIARIVIDNIAIYDRYGFVSYLRDGGDRIFLQRDFPVTRENESSPQMMETYTSQLIANREMPLAKYLTLINYDLQEEILRQIMELPEDLSQLNEILDQLDRSIKVPFLEDVIIRIINDPANVPPAFLGVLRYFSAYLYVIYKPEDDIRRVEVKAETRSGPGRPRKAEPEKYLAKITIDQLESDVTPVAINDLPNRLLDGDELVFIHTLYNFIFERVAYNLSAKSVKSDGRIRVLDLTEKDPGWRDVLPVEGPVYSAVIRTIREMSLSRFDDYRFYGTYLDNKFRIADKSSEVIRYKKSGEIDRRSNIRSKVCISYKKERLIYILQELGFGEPKINRKVPPREEIINSLIRSKTLSGDEDYETWSDEKLRYYFLWDVYGGKPELCNLIEEYMKENNMISGNGEA